MVRRASLLALDLLECRDLHPIDDALRLSRRSPEAGRRLTPELAGVRVFQRSPVAPLRRGGPGRAGRLVQRRNDLGDRLRGDLSPGSQSRQADRSTESDAESFVSEQAK